MQTATMIRQFKYNGMTLADPAPGKTPQQVGQLYARTYTELATAAVVGPDIKDGVATYTFLKAAGSKG